MPKELTLKEMSSRGGKTTFKKHGKEHFSKASKKRWAKYKAKKECDICEGSGVVLDNEPVYSGEPHMAATKEVPCECQE